MINANTMTVPMTATPTRTGSASADGKNPAAWAPLPCRSAAASGLVAISEGSGSIRLPTWVPRPGC